MEAKANLFAHENLSDELWLKSDFSDKMMRKLISALRVIVFQGDLTILKLMKLEAKIRNDRDGVDVPPMTQLKAFSLENERAVWEKILEICDRSL